MKRFKELLNEEVQWTSKTIEKIFLYEYIPVSESILKRWGKKLEREIFYHATSIKMLPKLINLQGTKKTISCYSNLSGTKYIKDGIWQSGLVVKVEGKKLLSWPDDIGSQPDEQGRRWIPTSAIEHYATDKFYSFDRIKGKIKDLKYDLRKKYNISNRQPQTDISNMTGKQKQLAIKEYFDGIEDIMLHDFPIFVDFFSRKDYEVPFYDENLVNEIKIKEIVYVDGYKMINAFRDGDFSDIVDEKKYKIYTFYDIMTDETKARMRYSKSRFTFYNKEVRMKFNMFIDAWIKKPDYPIEKILDKVKV